MKIAQLKIDNVLSFAAELPGRPCVCAELQPCAFRQRKRQGADPDVDRGVSGSGGEGGDRADCRARMRQLESPSFRAGRVSM